MKKILLLLLISSCTHNAWVQRGKAKGWIDSSSVTRVDSFKYKTYSKDSLFNHSFDTLRLSDTHFKTLYFYDSTINRHYIKTTLLPRDSVVYHIENKTIYKGLDVFEWLNKTSWKIIVIALLLLLITIMLLRIFKTN
jgi:hypothetical protein